MCGAAASTLEIDLEKLLRGGNSVLGRRRTARATHPPGARRLSDRCNEVAPSYQEDGRLSLR